MKNILSFLLVFPLMLWSQSDYSKAEKLFKDGKYEQARPVFESYLKEYPSHLKTIEYLGDLEGHQKSWDKAIVYYKKLKQLRPSEANYYFKYGGALGMKAKESNKFKALGMIGEVKESFEKAISLNPKHIEARWALVILYIQLPGIVGGSETKAIKYSNELLKLSPVDGYLSKGQIDEHFKRYTAAEKNYIKANTIGKSKITFQALYRLYLNKLNDPVKAQELKQHFDKNKQF
ncbi:tetratricopeptide repeat protein [Flavobacterium nackdongense]|uniref:Tetratricopeptide repeat protein n=1 Tax=Flavobacterium nackdongense TaxID=2547394 RepID=A0A4P6YH82_9FLAO|nr:tetratricopeptide repeat protein [Flavobacterium nackdongense]QBN19940.1 tetratricopeptide repeat protein [Flavobacterium nackdongense]